MPAWQGVSHGDLAWHLVLVQLQRPGTAASVVPELWQEEGRGSKQGGNQVTGVRKHKYLWGKSWEKLQGFMAIVLAFSFFSGKDAEVINEVTGNHGCSHSMADIGSPHFSSLFPAISM